MLATEYAKYYNIEAQQSGESDFSFRSWVAGALRDAGCIIEAHEAQQDARWDADNGGEVQTGVMGALAMALHGVDYGRTGETRVGDEIAAGVVASAQPKRQLSPAEVILMLELFG